MGLGSIGIPSMILILIIALLVFGPKKLPEISRAIGETFKAVKSSANELISDGDQEKPTKENSNKE